MSQFYTPAGLAIVAHPAEQEFKTDNNLVVTGVLPKRYGVPVLDLSTPRFGIPYRALNATPTNHQFVNNALVQVTVFVNGVPTARSAFVPFQFRY